MLQNSTQVESVNFRLYFKVIIRQNQSFCLMMTENLQFQPASCFEAYLAFSRCLFSEFAFYFTNMTGITCFIIKVVFKKSQRSVKWHNSVCALKIC